MCFCIIDTYQGCIIWPDCAVHSLHRIDDYFCALCRINNDLPDNWEIYFALVCIVSTISSWKSAFEKLYLFAKSLIIRSAKMLSLSMKYSNQSYQRTSGIFFVIVCAAHKIRFYLPLFFEPPLLFINNYLQF